MKDVTAGLNPIWVRAAWRATSLAILEVKGKGKGKDLSFKNKCPHHIQQEVRPSVGKLLSQTPKRVSHSGNLRPNIFDRFNKSPTKVQQNQ